MTPVVLTVHDVVPHVRRLPTTFEDVLLRRAYHGANAIVVYHDTLRIELIDRFGIDSDQISVVPHPIRMVGPVSEEDVDERAVLFFGSFRPNKGIPVLLEAISSLTGLRDTKFIFAGTGERVLEDQVLEAAQRDSRIIPEIGKVSNERSEQLFRMAALVVLPYCDFHSQSGVLADAYSFGRPLLVTDVGALGATVREDRSGWVAAPNDPRQLASKLQEALADRKGRLAAAKAAMNAGRDRSHNAVGRELRRIYAQVTRS